MYYFFTLQMHGNITHNDRIDKLLCVKTLPFAHEKPFRHFMPHYDNRFKHDIFIRLGIFHII